MEQCPSSEINSHSCSEKIPHLLWNSAINYHVHKSLPLVPILSLIEPVDPVHTLPTYLFEIHSNIIVPSTPRSSKYLFLSGFLTTIFYAYLISPIHAI